MAMNRGQNLPQVKINNLTSIKWHLFRHAPISRAEIAEALELNPSTVTNIVSEMMAQGVVRELPVVPEENRGAGRRPIAIDLNPNVYHVIGIHLGWHVTQICLTNLRGEIIAREQAPRAPESYPEMLDLITGMGKRMLEASGDTPVLGMGIAIPGIVSSRDGMFLQGESREDWIEKPIAADMSKRIGIPARADNLGRARAKRIALFYPEIVDGSDSFLVFYVSEGISCHMQLMSHSLHGEENSAGEIGHMIMIPEGNPEITRDQTLDRLSGTAAIRKELQTLLKETDQPSLLRSLCADAEDIPVPLILMAQRAGDPMVCEVLNRAMHYIGIALTNIVDLVHPRYIVLTGQLFRNEENVQMIREFILKHAYSADSGNLKLVYQDAGEYADAVNGAALAVHRFFLNSAMN